MSSFERLHPSVQHHVVNSLGWSALRAHQEQAIGPILDGHHVLVQAPTAGGKTEAALLPVLSRMLSEGWGAPSVLYLCPIKALLNDLEVRIQRMASLFGLRVGVWHGDVNASSRRRITRDPPEILLATPESVEVMLVSRLVEHRNFFAPLRSVIVDEVHAFAGDDRGWHLLGLLERVNRLAEGPIQRIALSATLSNADGLLDWFVAGRDGSRRVIVGAAAAGAEADVQLDFVGSLQNAAQVISRLHAGEKRLVFCDSRTQVEALATELRVHGVSTFVSHSSLSRGERLRAEAAFAQGNDCVIVATSTLELGIDVGDLDRVIQVDAPFTVAAFLQRLGRSGRRQGSRRNCLFLATTEDALLRALAVLHLWREGYVEAVEPPPLPFHVLAQQILALTLQEGGITFPDLEAWLGAWRETAGISRGAAEELLSFMLEDGILFDDQGLLGVGPEGEARYGPKNFLEVFSVFLSPPLIQVYHGRNELGQVHEDSFRRRDDGPTLLSLGGRGWKVTHLDRGSRRAFVEPGEQAGRSRWLGTGHPMHFKLCQAVRHVLGGDEFPSYLSRRARDAITALREEFYWLPSPGTELIVDSDKGVASWWTFAGDRYNAAAAEALAAERQHATYDSFSLRVTSGEIRGLPERVSTAMRRVREIPRLAIRPEDSDQIKFSDCLPIPLLEIMLQARYGPAAEAAAVAGRPLTVRFAEQ